MLHIETTYLIKIIGTIVVIILAGVVQLFFNKIIGRTLKKHNFSKQRRRVIVRITNLLILISAIILISGLWGVNTTSLLAYSTTILSVIGIAFFAQWSILSNITASLILFFNHPMQIGHDISIVEKDFTIEGQIEDISFFFMHIKTKEGENLTIPTSMVLQRIVVVKDK